MIILLYISVSYIASCYCLSSDVLILVLMVSWFRGHERDCHLDVLQQLEYIANWLILFFSAQELTEIGIPTGIGCNLTCLCLLWENFV